MTTVTWTKIPIVGLPEMACQIDVDGNGRAIDADGEPLDMSERPNKCGEDGYWMLGSIFLCKRHAAEVAVLMGDNIEDITAAWRDLL